MDMDGAADIGGFGAATYELYEQLNDFGAPLAQRGRPQDPFRLAVCDDLTKPSVLPSSRALPLSAIVRLPTLMRSPDLRASPSLMPIRPSSGLVNMA